MDLTPFRLGFSKETGVRTEACSTVDHDHLPARVPENPRLTRNCADSAGLPLPRFAIELSCAAGTVLDQVLHMFRVGRWNHAGALRQLPLEELLKQTGIKAQGPESGAALLPLG